MINQINGTNNSPNTLTTTIIGFEELDETFSFRGIVRNIVFLVVACVFLLLNYRQNTLSIVFIGGFQFALQILIGFLKYQKIKQLERIKQANQGQSYSQVLIIREKFGFVTKLASAIVNSVMLLLIIVFASNALTSQVIMLPTTITSIHSLRLDLLLGVWIGWNWLELIGAGIRYLAVNTMKQVSGVVEQQRIYLLVNKKLGLIGYLPLSFGFLVILYFIGIPIIYLFLFFGIFLLIFTVSILEILRLSQQGTKSAVVKEGNVILKSELENGLENELENENALGSVFGIMNLKRTGYSILSVGQSKKAENSIILMKDKLLFWQVPVTGGNQVLGSVMASDLNFFWNRDQIRQEGERMMRSLPLSKIWEDYGVNLIAVSDITEFNFKNTEFTFRVGNGTQYKYLLSSPEDVDQIKGLLPQTGQNVDPHL